MEQNNLGNFVVAGQIFWDCQEQIMPSDNFACFTVDNGEQQTFMMSGNPAYCIANEHSQQPAIQKKCDYIGVNRQVGVLGKTVYFLAC